MTNRNIAHIAIMFVLWVAALGVVSSATQSQSHLPVVFGAPLAAVTVCDGKAPIHNRDTGDLDAILTLDGRFILAYQDRASGSLVHVVEHIGAGVVEVTGPPVLGLADAVPQFSPSGPKQGSVALVAMAGGKNRLYYTQREEDETPNEGPYGIWCVEF